MIHERGKECFDTGTNWDKSTRMEQCSYPLVNSVWGGGGGGRGTAHYDVGLELFSSRVAISMCEIVGCVVMCVTLSLKYISRNFFIVDLQKLISLQNFHL